MPQIIWQTWGSSRRQEPSIVLADCDFDKAVEWVMFGCFWTNGQVRCAVSDPHPHIHTLGGVPPHPPPTPTHPPTPVPNRTHTRARARTCLLYREPRARTA